MQVPVLAFGGWADNYMNTVAHLVENLTVPVKGIVGPWVHQYPHQAVPGPAIGFLQLAIRWWDRWLKDVPNGAGDDPAMRAYMLHSAPPDASCRAPGRALGGGTGLAVARGRAGGAGPVARGSAGRGGGALACRSGRRSIWGCMRASSFRWG